jgi:hypothetical protein
MGLLCLLLKWVDNNEITVVLITDTYVYCETKFLHNYSFTSAEVRIMTPLSFNNLCFISYTFARTAEQTEGLRIYTLSQDTKVSMTTITVI